MLNRRYLLKGGGLALASLGLGGSPGFLSRALWAAEESASVPSGRRKVLVTLFLRGAMDGLAAVPPLGGAALGKLRPRLALQALRGGGVDALIDLGNGFGLHPALRPLLDFWQERSLAIVHAVGSPDPSRSHFDAQDYMESGTPGRKATPSGWLNRVSGLLGHEATPWRAVSLSRSLPRSLSGEAPAVALEDLSQFRLRQSAATKEGRIPEGGSFQQIYDRAAEDLLRDTGSEAFRAMEMLQAARLDRYSPAAGIDYPASPLGRSLRQIAALIKADLGLEIACTESGGWDTHVQQGGAAGSFARRAADLAASIHAFWRDLGPYRDQVVLTTMTEFGRTVRENGSGGTDHGHGSCLFALGTRIRGGQVHGQLGSLEPESLHEGRDLPVTTDFRAVFAELAGRHLGVADDRRIFPGWSGSRFPLFQA